MEEVFPPALDAVAAVVGFPKVLRQGCHERQNGGAQSRETAWCIDSQTPLYISLILTTYSTIK